MGGSNADAKAEKAARRLKEQQQQLTQAEADAVVKPVTPKSSWTTPLVVDCF